MFYIQDVWHNVAYRYRTAGRCLVVLAQGGTTAFLGARVLYDPGLDQALIVCSPNCGMYYA